MSDTWIITGGSSDIAAAIYDELDKRAKEKITIFAQYLNHEINTNRTNLDIRPVKADLSDAADTAGFIDAVKDSGLTPTHIIHLAAVPYNYVKIKAWDSASVDKQMRVGLYSFAEVCKVFMPVMAKNKTGDILVMLTSAISGLSDFAERIPATGSALITGDTTPKFMCEYVSVKAALLGYTQSLASEYFSKGIRVHTMSPDMIETKFLRNIDPKIIEMDAAGSEGGAHRTAADVADGILSALGY